MYNATNLYDNYVNNVIKDNTTTNANERLALIVSEAKKFISSTEIWDRLELKFLLRNVIFEDKGRFLCLLGDKNTGKSVILSELNKLD